MLIFDKFTSTLEHLLAGAYEAAKVISKDTPIDCDWFKLQRLVSVDQPDDKAIQELVQKAQSQSIKMPFIRKVLKDIEVKGGAGKVTRILAKGDTIVCDIVGIALHRICYSI